MYNLTNFGALLSVSVHSPKKKYFPKGISQKQKFYIQFGKGHEKDFASCTR